METRTEHWDRIYSTKAANERSWTQAIPQTSLDLIHACKLPLSSGIIDIGGGDSRLVDCLLDEGYDDITVLDLSAAAIDAAKLRLGDRAEQVQWIVGDVTQFHPVRTYDLWHDRAAFHFLTDPREIEVYAGIVERAASHNLVIGTFSEQGPLKCSGLDVHRYSEAELIERFYPTFQKLSCLREQHTTPSGTTQEFIFCAFERVGGKA